MSRAATPWWRWSVLGVLAAWVTHTVTTPLWERLGVPAAAGPLALRTALVGGIAGLVAALFVAWVATQTSPQALVAGVGGVLGFLVLASLVMAFGAFAAGMGQLGGAVGGTAIGAGLGHLVGQWVAKRRR